MPTNIQFETRSSPISPPPILVQEIKDNGAAPLLAPPTYRKETKEELYLRKVGLCSKDVLRLLFLRPINDFLFNTVTASCLASGKIWERISWNPIHLLATGIICLTILIPALLISNIGTFLKSTFFDAPRAFLALLHPDLWIESSIQFNEETQCCETHLVSAYEQSSKWLWNKEKDLFSFWDRVELFLETVLDRFELTPPPKN